jgi:hypothetical protein
VILELSEIHTLFAEAHGANLEILERQHELDALRDHRIVLDQQDAHRTVPSWIDHLPLQW